LGFRFGIGTDRNEIAALEWYEVTRVDLGVETGVSRLLGPERETDGVFAVQHRENKVPPTAGREGFRGFRLDAHNLERLLDVLGEPEPDFLKARWGKLV
jgi:hypothetical protein